MRRRIRLSEGKLHRIIKESVRRILNEVSIDTIFNAQKKVDDEYENYRDGIGEFPDKRDRQYDLFNDEVWNRIHAGGPEIDKYVNRIGQDFDMYGDLEQAADSDYFERIDLENAIAEKYGLSKEVAALLLARYLSKTYGRYMTGNVYGDNSDFK